MSVSCMIVGSLTRLCSHWLLEARTLRSGRSRANAGEMLAHRLRHWPIINRTSAPHLVLAGECYRYKST